MNKLIYVPAGATLFVNDVHGAPQRIMKLSKPANLLVTNTYENKYEVLYMNESWLVRKNNTYEVTE